MTRVYRRAGLRTTLPSILVVASLMLALAACGGSEGNSLDGSTMDVIAPDMPDAGNDRSQTGETTSEVSAPDNVQPEIQPDTIFPGGCCGSDTECNEGARCIGLDIDPLGVCVPIPAVGACYERTDCGEGQACQGAHVTICVMSSLPATGTCVDMPDHCCYEDIECDEGLTCEGANDAVWGPGECHPTPDPGRCWRPEQCPEGFACLGATPCGCLVDCYWAGSGYCTPPDGSCCFFDGDCAEGLHCVGGQIGGTMGHCKPPLTGGDCWGNEDCPINGQICFGEKICPCDAFCDVEDEPGHCTMGEDLDCCYDAQDCSPGLVCVPEHNLTTFGVCKPMSMGDGCWFDSDCAANETCFGVYICPCDADCGQGDTIGDCMPNWCELDGGECGLGAPTSDGCPYGWGPVNLAGCDEGDLCCMPDQDMCAGKGETVSGIPDDEPCCDSLDAIAAEEIDPETGQCEALIGGMICAACGDGQCESGWENPCNCPEDCKEDPTDPMALCAATGGTWNGCGSGCGPWSCGEPFQMDCPAVCVSQCECGDGMGWDPQQGCVSCTCNEWWETWKALLTQVAQCNSVANCIDVPGTSCGCTHNLVVNKDVDLWLFWKVAGWMGDDGCSPFVSDCDCPPAEGFACMDGLCTWNYLLP